MRLIRNLRQNPSSKEVGSFLLFWKEKTYFKQWSISFAILAFLLTFSNAYAVCPSYAGTEQITENGVTYDVLYFGTSTDFPGSAETGSPTDPLTDWNSSNGGVDATNDCGGDIYLKFVGCYFNTDNEFGDINYSNMPSQNNVILDGQGAFMENLAASSSFIRCDGLDNWTIRNFTFSGWNQNAILLTDMTNTVVENCIFDSNPTQRAVRVDNDDNASDVTFNNCIFSNNPPISETPSTGAVEVREDEFAGPLVVNFNGCDFDCNARQGFGGGALWISPVSFPSNNGPEVNISGGSFVNNFSGTDTGDGGAIGINGEDSFLNIDGTLFSCNYSEASTGDGGGGAIRIQAGPTVTIDNSTFYGNYCTNSAGSIPAGGYGGAININSTSNISTLTISNSTFTGNQASRGGAFYLESGNVTFDNVLVTGNESATDPGGGVNNAGASFTVMNTSIIGNTPDDLLGAITDNGGVATVTDPGITACEACYAVPPPGCEASGSELALTCEFFCSTGVPPGATGDAGLTIDMTNFVVPICTEPLDYTYVFLAVDAAGNVVCEFPATDVITQDPLNGFVTIAGPADGIPDAMDPAIQQANLCAGLAPGDYTLVGFHYLTADVPPIVTPFVGQTLTQIGDYLTDPPTSPAACGVIGTEVPFTILEPIEVIIATSCPAVPDGTYLADITVTGGYPLEAGAGTYALTTNFGVTTYTFGTPITAQVIPAGQSVDVTVAADGNGANGTTPPGPLCFDCMATIVSEAEPVCQACPDIVDGTLSAEVNAAPAADVCSGDVISVCVDIDLTNDPTATVEFSNDGGTTWLPGVATSATEYCLDFTEINTTCDAVAVSYMAQFTMSSLADMTCSLDTQPIAGAAVTVNVYPDIANAANAMITNDGACGPGLTQGCANFIVTNTYDANGATPDFSAEAGTGAFDFVITNTGAPTACESLTLPATYNCASLCPDIVDGTLSAEVNAAPAADVCSGDVISVCVDVDLTNDPTATVEFSNDGGTTWLPGVATSATEYCLDFTETNATCDAVAVSYMAQFTLSSLADAACSLDTQPIVGGAAVTVNVYPGLAIVANAMITDDGACGPSLTQDCANFTVTNTYDANGATPDFSAEAGTGSFDFVITNIGAPAACESVTLPATYSCATCDVLIANVAVDCAGGDGTATITVTATGGSGVYDYSIDNGATWQVSNVFGPLANSTYTIIVRDNADTACSDMLVDLLVSCNAPAVPDVTIDKDDADNTDDMQTVSTGDDAIFTITVTNTGDEDLCNVMVADANGAACVATYTDNGGTLVVGGVWTYTCTVPGTAGNYVNTAVVTAEGCTSGTPVDDEDDSTVFVDDPTTTTPDVTVDKNDADNGDDEQTVSTGDDATFTITVTNTGDEDLCNIMVTDANGAACVATYTDNGGTLVVGGVWTYQCTVPNTLGGYVNTAVVTAEGCDSGTSVEDEDASCVNVADPVLDALKTSDFTDVNGDGLLNPGEVITYTIVLTNYGTADALNVMFSDVIPVGTTLLGNETTTLGTISAGTDPVTANLGTLTANGGTATITFEVTVDANTADGFIIINQGTFTSDNHPDVPTDDPDTPTTPDDPTDDPVVDPSCTDADNGTWNH